ncbi:MAG TPA: YggS family pyridoxal phosphate-dependent enzyme [Solirubrobacteraceae bacterium]|nr:YggS family pyridoxal phosphate-dependent enzyme [Solirubrobacteraceae bacterium]
MAGLTADRVRANLAAVRGRVDAAADRAGRRGEDVRILAAVKYLPAAELGLLAEAGIDLVGENRAQDLVEKFAAHGDLFRWHFIGQLQSRKVKLIAPRVDLIHSVDSESAVRELDRHGRPGLEVLIEVNVAGDAGKAGIRPDQLDAMIARCPVPVVGLMTMPPRGGDGSRRAFAGLRELAAGRGLRELSMGTTQDFETAVEEGATIVRIGTSLYR